MKKDYVSVIFDRKKKVAVSGEGAVEICIYLNHSERKLIKYCTCTPKAWLNIQKSQDLRKETMMYAQVIDTMCKNGEELTLQNLNYHLGVTPVQKKKDDRKKRLLDSPTGFIEFINEEAAKENYAKNSLKRIQTTIEALLRAQMLLRLQDLTDINVADFEEFLKEEDPSRTEAARYNYHKIIKKFCHRACELNYIIKNPYSSDSCHFKKGEAKERRPLLEDELVEIRELEDLTPYEEHARDLFIFSAYTGLAYVDNQLFDFERDAEWMDDMYYIYGERMKTSSTFLTPILPPAMEVLKKYDYHLPRMSNQKMNEYLQLIKARVRLNKPLTTHIARHTFATLVLSYDVPIEDLARMLGHKDVSTTKLYAKILAETISRHSKNIVMRMK